jgi:hypothetical protein
MMPTAVINQRTSISNRGDKALKQLIFKGGTIMTSERSLDTTVTQARLISTIGMSLICSS